MKYIGKIITGGEIYCKVANPYLSYGISKQELTKIRRDFEQHLREEQPRIGVPGIQGMVATSNVNEFKRQIAWLEEAIRQAT